VAAFAFAGALACPTGVFARAKTDHVFLVNGDRLTGEIKQLDRGILQLSTDAISTINIEWDDVDSLNSVYQFRVEDRRGDKFFGAIFLAHDGLLQVVSEGRSVEVHADSVVAITPLEASFWQQLDGAVSLGYSYTKADGLSQFTLDSWIQRQTSVRRTRLDLDWIITNSNETESQVTYDATLDHRKLLRATLFAQLTGEAQRNDELGLDLRTSFAAALGKKFIQSNRTDLTASAGLSVNREWASDGTQSDNLEGVLVVEHEMFAYDFPKIDYAAQISVYPGLTEWGRVRSELDIRFKREIISDFFVELSFYDSYDNRPPGGGTKTDYGLVFSLGYSF
jgi:putative salt-induced outer membrane protein YdiY